jgi:hypothetical protein
MTPLIVIVPLLAGAAALLPILARRLDRPHPHLVRRDPTLNARAERRARQLLRSAAGEEAYAMYAQLGFIGVDGGDGAPSYGYLIYPHRPIVAYDAGSGELLSEYCVRFPDGSDPSAGEWLPDADDVLAKWMALHGDERRLIGEANMHLPGRQLDPAMVRRDLRTLRSWLGARARGSNG